MIEVRFSEDQFERLLKLVSIGTVVLSIYGRKEIEDEFWDIEQFLYSKAEDEGLEDLYQYDEELEAFAPSEKIEDEIYEYLNDYNEDMFWQTLCTRLAIRDLERELGVSKVEEMESQKRIQMLAPLFEKYAEEFEKNGIDNLVLVKRDK